jgi:hypothetical protein
MRAITDVTDRPIKYLEANLQQDHSLFIISKNANNVSQEKVKKEEDENDEGPVMVKCLVSSLHLLGHSLS